MFGHRKKQEVSINLTPLIDVVFILLIFFMVTTNFNRESQIDIDLPEATADPLDIQPKLLEISVNSEGRFFINAKSVVNTQKETLVKAIKEIAGDQTDWQVIISGDANAPYQSIITAMEASRESGYFDFNLVTVNPTEEK